MSSTVTETDVIQEESAAFKDEIDQNKETHQADIPFT
jgi:hypothetical protein